MEQACVHEGWSEDVVKEEMCPLYWKWTRPSSEGPAGKPQSVSIALPCPHTFIQPQETRPGNAVLSALYLVSSSRLLRGPPGGGDQTHLSLSASPPTAFSTECLLCGALCAGETQGDSLAPSVSCDEPLPRGLWEPWVSRLRDTVDPCQAHTA